MAAAPSACACYQRLGIFHKISHKDSLCRSEIAAVQAQAGPKMKRHVVRYVSAMFIDTCSGALKSTLSGPMCLQEHFSLKSDSSSAMLSRAHCEL
jgi:hypothetical protein